MGYRLPVQQERSPVHFLDSFQRHIRSGTVLWGIHSFQRIQRFLSNSSAWSVKEQDQIELHEQEPESYAEILLE